MVLTESCHSKEYQKCIHLEANLNRIYDDLCSYHHGSKMLCACNCAGRKSVSQRLNQYTKDEKTFYSNKCLKNEH